MSRADAGPWPDVFGPASRDQVVVGFTGTHAGTGPLTWGQKAILRDMRDSGSQFSMPGRMALPAGDTVTDAAARLRDLMSRHAALRARLGTGPGGQATQEVAGSGQAALDVLTLPDAADPEQYALALFDNWPRERFDFARDWPLRMAVIRHRGACTHLVFVLSHLVADGGAALLLLADLTGRTAHDPQRAQLPDVARSEQTPALRQLSQRTMRYWEAQLRSVPALTFGPPARPPGPPRPRYRQVRFRSVAAHLALLALAGRTGTDVSRVTLAVVATAIGRATGVRPLTVNVMVNNRFRRGLADVIAPVAQNSVVTIDVADTTVDAVVAQARSASVVAGLRAYYDPDDLGALTDRLDAERGHLARVSCRFNDQRTMIVGADAEAAAPAVTSESISRQLAATSLTWLEPVGGLHVQANIIVENHPGVVSLFVQFDQWCLTDGQVEELLRGVEQVAVEAAFDPHSPTRVPGPAAAPDG